MLPVTQCLIFWQVHRAHDWAYTDWGGGHMVTIGMTDEKGYKEWHCPGLSHIGKHRGQPKGRWVLQTPIIKGSHKGLKLLEADVDTDSIID